MRLGQSRMDAAAARGEHKRGTPLVPPNYVSLRHLQELCLKEKEEQRQREEDAAATRVREEERQREEDAAAIRVREEQRQREEEAAARKVQEEEAAARRVREPAAAPRPRMKAPTNTSFRYTERHRKGQQFVVMAQRPPPQHGDGAIWKKDVGAGGDYRREKGPDGDAANASRGGGRRAENKGKEKVSADMKGDPAEPATTPSHAGKPEEKRKVGAFGDQGTASGTSHAPGEAAISSPRIKPSRKKRSGCCNTRTAMASEPVVASLTEGIKSANKGKKKTSEVRRTDVPPISDVRDGKTLQPHIDTEGIRNQSHGGVGVINTDTEAKSEGAGKKQPVVEVKVQPCPCADGIGNSRSSGPQGMKPEAKSKGPEKKQPMMEVKAQICQSPEVSSNWSSSSSQGTTQEAKSEGLGENEEVVRMRAMARRRPRDVKSSARHRHGSSGGNGAAQQHGMVWMPKVAAVLANADVE